MTVQPAAGPWQTETAAMLAAKLPGVLGEKTAKSLAALGVRTVGDLLRHVPRHWMSGTDSSRLADLRHGEHAAVMARIVNAEITGQEPRRRVAATLTDGRTRMSISFFARSRNYKKNSGMLEYWAKQLTPGERGIFAGKVGEFRGEPQFTNPDFVIVDEDGRITGGAQRNHTMGRLSQAGGLIGIYPQTATLPTWTIAECIEIVLGQLQLADPWPQWLRDEAGLLDLMAAFRAVHRPADRAEIERGLERLRFDEAFRTQLAMAHRRALVADHGAVPRARVAGRLLDDFDAALPFPLTRGQTEVSEQILEELSRDRPMQRLLQGEVGSGKTVVAVRAMLAVIDAGGQAALLAPTEVLVSQHARSINALLGDLGAGAGLLGPDHATRVVTLTGSMPAAERSETLRLIASGEAGIVIGTHALLTEDVAFADLGLIVVDEQHRFGVEQRAALSGRQVQRPHVLVMTATPIPRTVAMTIFGDLEVSTLTEVPAGRSEVSTVVVDERATPAWVPRVWQRILEEVAQGRQAFVVCPRVSSSRSGRGRKAQRASEEEGASGDGDLEQSRAVEELYEELRTGPLSSVRVGMLHGQLPTEEKDRVMAAFARGGLDVLVATTVVEVGVDVPNASVMVISDAENFGISQLHQLRGRIGRGEHPGVCLLLTTVDPDSPARARLDAVAATRDGFRLAEADLAQRREGDVLGSAQSGSRSSLRLLRVLEHAELIDQARMLSQSAIARDPELRTPGFADAITETELAAQEEWLERN